MRPLCIIGSLNVDLTVRLPRFHNPGETITGHSFGTYAGGKGGNQAVAAARLSGRPRFVGKLGDDFNGAFYLDTLRREGVDAGYVESLPGVESGVALIEVDEAGENRIAVVPGANGLVDEAFVLAAIEKQPDDTIYLMQLEIPMPTVEAAAKAIRAKGGTLVLDPAPAVPLSRDLLSLVDWLTPNEHELRLLTGLDTGMEPQVEEAARTLLHQGVGNVVAKLGGRGCLWVHEGGSQFVPGFAVRVVDTTAAGDSFNAGLAVALAQGIETREALRFANAVGALSVTGAGAQAAMPGLQQVEALLREQA